MRNLSPGVDHAYRTERIFSSVAATLIALSCGTNYGFSAWAPQFAERLQLTATQTNLIGNFGNIGMYAMGIPGGILIDSRGPRWGVVLGCLCLACGYFPLKIAYDRGPGSMGVPMLCIFAFLSGTGGCTAFSAAIKASASNWPNHRGTATAFPLSAFGLSAFFYTTNAALWFPGDTSGYLALLAYGTTLMTFVGMLFLKIVPVVRDDGQGAYGVVPGDDQSSAKRNDSLSETHRMKRIRARGHKQHSSKDSVNGDAASDISSLVDSDNEDGSSGDMVHHDADPKDLLHSHQRREITGWALVRTSKFWQLFILLSLLCGVGLMTINNIGNNAKALWRHFDDTVSKDFILKRQLTHVSILSLCSFSGRLISGIGSDWLIRNHASRFWTLVVSAFVFVAAQCIALQLENPRDLFWISGLTGIAYGILFGVYPALVADAFGPSGLALNWGCMTWAPVLSGNIYNLAYGHILDQHSVFLSDSGGKAEERVCDEGRSCYASAYWITLCSSIIGVLWSLWCIRQEKLEVLRDGTEGRRKVEA